MQVNIHDKLYREIFDYCAINDIDVEEYINSILKQKFMVEKYGDRPGIGKPTQQPSGNDDKIDDKTTEPIIEPINEPIKKEKAIDGKKEEAPVEKPKREKHRKLS